MKESELKTSITLIVRVEKLTHIVIQSERLKKSLGTICSQLISYIEFIAYGTQGTICSDNLLGISRGKLEKEKYKLKCQENRTTCSRRLQVPQRPRRFHETEQTPALQLIKRNGKV